jgi:hypothetical protein
MSPGYRSFDKLLYIPCYLCVQCSIWPYCKMALAPAGRGIEILSVYSLFLCLTTITVALRVYCRVHIQKAFGWDDWFATLSWVRRSSKHHVID